VKNTEVKNGLSGYNSRDISPEINLALKVGYPEKYKKIGKFTIGQRTTN